MKRMCSKNVRQFGYHPFYFQILFKLQQAKQVSPDILFPIHILQLLLEDHKVFPGQMKYIILPACSGSLEKTSGMRDQRAEKVQELASFDVKEVQFLPEVFPDVSNYTFHIWVVVRVCRGLCDMHYMICPCPQGSEWTSRMQTVGQGAPYMKKYMLIHPYMYTPSKV